MPFPSGDLVFHNRSVYDSDGGFVRNLNATNAEHSCNGRNAAGEDSYFAISFASGPSGGGLGDVTSHNATTGA